MSTKVLEKLVRRLSGEVIELRSFVISIAARDGEGAYRPEFVKKIKKASEEKAHHEFAGKNSLLKLLKKK